MTGFRLTWRIDNGPLIARISEVGRRIETPHFGDTFDEISDSSSDKVYKVTLTPPKDLSQQMTNRSLVIEVNIVKNPSDEVYAFTSYKLFKEWKTWTDAELHCENEGGRLASIHSWWEQTLAGKAAEGVSYVWLGGRKTEGQWQWVDNATWSFENWKSGYPRNQEYLQMENGQWFDFKSSDKDYFLCQGKRVALTESGLTSIEFNKEQLNFFPFHLIFKSRASDQPTVNTSARKDDKTSGFTLNWFLKDRNGIQVTENLPARSEDWKGETLTSSYEQPFLHEMVQLATRLRLQNMTKDEMLMEVIHHKSQTNVMTKAAEMCTMGQIKEGEREQVFSKVLSLVTASNCTGEPLVEDFAAGYELFSAVVLCPPGMVFRTYMMIDKLLSVETERIIIQTMVNIFHSGVLTDKIALSLARQFYQVLADTYDLQHGNILLSTLTTAQMEAVIRKDWPFFTNNTDLVRKCLHESNCDAIQGIYPHLGKWINFLFLNIYYRCLTRAVPPPDPPDS